MKRFLPAALAALLLACNPPPTAVLVTLTAPVPTATVAPVSLVPVIQAGAGMRYADATTLLGVPSGAFRMGHGTAEDPEHSVTLSDYWIYATKVTNAQYALCVAAQRCDPPDAVDNPGHSDFASRNLPVVGVTYDQAQAYCNYMNGSLPTEAQWEKAARGPNSLPYPWGDIEPSCDLLNFDNCVKHLTPVGTYDKGRSPYGALDMEGNVFEWVADWYDPLYYKVSPPGDPPGPADGRARVLRGSDFRSDASQVVAYARSFASPRTHKPNLGFRCAVSNPAYFAPACQFAPTVAQAQLSSLTVECPKISIDVKVTACRYGGGALVTFNNDHPNDPNASFGGILGCELVSGTPGSYPLSYQCKQHSDAVLSTTCTYSGIQGSDCPAHYALDPAAGVCQWDNSRTTGIDCPSGEFFDPVHHCCRIETGRLTDRPICPVGSIFTEAQPGKYACLPAGSALPAPLVQQAVNPPVCPGQCALSPVTCTDRNLVFCATTCACISVGVKCPTH